MPIKREAWHFYESSLSHSIKIDVTVVTLRSVELAQQRNARLRLPSIDSSIVNFWKTRGSDDEGLHIFKKI